jgi:SAM-dependent methyltransferase
LASHTPDPNASSPAFAGSIPREYHRRLVPMLFTDYADDIARRVGPIENAAVLETAAGTGVVTQTLRAALPASTALTASDFSEHMLAVAREFLLESAKTGVEFVTADATDLPFADASFDAVVCQFGVMFFPDEPEGYRQAARVLKPGGRFLFSVWDDLVRNPLPNCMNEVLAALSPTDPPRFLEVPYRPLDLTTIARDLQQSGFGEIRSTVLPKPCRVASAVAAAETFVQATPLGAQVAERGLGAEAITAGAQAFADRFAGGDDSAPITAPMQAVVFEACKAG